MERTLILDIALCQKDCDVLKRLGFDIVEPNLLTQPLLHWNGWERLDPQRTLLVFPGNGAEKVKAYFPDSFLLGRPWTTVHAQRVWHSGEEPRAYVDRFTDAMLLGRFDHVVIIDDVVSSGRTIQKIRILNEPWIPAARWHALAWLAQRKTARTSAQGFDSRFVSYEVGTVDRLAPINSLSTLITDTEMAENFAQRHFPNDAEYEMLLDLLRRQRDG